MHNRRMLALQLRQPIAHAVAHYGLRRVVQPRCVPLTEQLRGRRIVLYCELTRLDKTTRIRFDEMAEGIARMVAAGVAWPAHLGIPEIDWDALLAESCCFLGTATLAGSEQLGERVVWLLDDVVTFPRIRVRSRPGETDAAEVFRGWLWTATWRHSEQLRALESEARTVAPDWTRTRKVYEHAASPLERWPRGA